MSLKHIPIDEAELTKAINKLRKDRWLKNPIKANPGLVTTCKANPFNSLITAICGQQISIHAAASIKRKLQDSVKSNSFKPKEVAALREAKLRACGLSQTKSAAVQACAKHCIAQSLTVAACNKLTDEELIERLIQIKGVGPWTVHMVMIFGLGRPDVMPFGDAGILNGARRLFKLDDIKQSRAKLEQVAPNWAPYRTVAAAYLWANV